MDADNSQLTTKAPRHKSILCVSVSKWLAWLAFCKYQNPETPTELAASKERSTGNAADIKNLCSGCDVVIVTGRDRRIRHAALLRARRQTLHPSCRFQNCDAFAGCLKEEDCGYLACSAWNRTPARRSGHLRTEGNTDSFRHGRIRLQDR